MCNRVQRALRAACCKVCQFESDECQACRRQNKEGATPDTPLSRVMSKGLSASHLGSPQRSLVTSPYSSNNNADVLPSHLLGFMPQARPDSWIMLIACGCCCLYGLQCTPCELHLLAAPEQS